MNLSLLHLASLACAAGLALAACGDDAKRPLGGSCDNDSDCVSGLCAGNVCLSPEGDDDLDGIINSVEKELGSNPQDDDTDADGIADGEEIDRVVNVDTDEDTLADVVESATDDEDDDCIPDQYDARNAVKDSDLSPMLPIVCSDLGVCAGQRGVMQVECSTGTARCVYSGVTGYESPETSCDGLDQNCDGEADDGQPDRDGDGDADCIDVDWDNDETADQADNCPTTANPDQADSDGDGIGNACTVEYRLVFLDSPDEVTASVPFSVQVGIAATGGDDAPLPEFRGSITLALSAGGATLGGTLTQDAGNDGTATFDDLTLDAAGDGFVLEATSGDLGIARSPSFSALAGVVAQFTFEEAPARVTAGEAFGFELVARDENGNIVPGFDGTVTFTSDDDDAVLPDDVTYTLADGGSVDISGVELRRAGTRTLTATSGDVVSEIEIDVDAAAFDGLVLSGASEVVAGEELAFDVIAADAFGNPVPDYDTALTVTTTDDLADVPAPIVPTSPGTYSDVVTGGRAGAHTLTVSAGGGVDATLDYSVLAGAAAELVVEAPASVGAAVAFPVTVTAFDAFDNVAEGFRGTVTLTSGDGQATLPAAHPYVAADAGAFEFTGVQLRTAGAQTIAANAGGGLSGTADVTVVAGDATALTIAQAPATVVAGEAFSITVELRDASGNLAADASRPIVITAGATELESLTATTSSVVIPNLTLTAAGTTTITATATGLALSDTADIAVTAGAGRTIELTGPAGAVAGSGFDVTVRVLDQFDNVASGYRGTVTFTTNDPATSPAAIVPTAYTFTAGDAGAHTFTGGVTLRTSGARTVTVTDATLATPSDVINVTVGGGAAARIELTGPATAVAGAPFEVTATVYDANGNIATGYTGSVVFSATVVPNRPAADLPSNYTFTAADGGRHVFTAAERVTLFAAGALVVTVTDQTPLPTAVSNLNVTVTPAAAASLSFTTTATQPIVAGTAFGGTVTALDAHGNTATGYTGRVVFTTNDTHVAPAPVLPATYTFVAGDAGVHAFTGFTLYTAGARTVTVTDQTPIADATADLAVTITAGPAVGMGFLQQPTAVVAGVAIAPTVTVGVVDQYLNPTTNAGTAVTLALTTNSGRSALTGAQATTAAGVASFATLTLDRPGVGYVLTATATGFTATTSNAFDVTWQAPTAGTPTVTTRGNCVDVTYASSHNLGQRIDVAVEYNLVADDPDAGWLRATQCGTDPGAATDPVGVDGLKVGTASANYVFRWNAPKDLGSLTTREVQVRVTTSLGTSATTSAASANYTFDGTWAGTFTASTNSREAVDAALADVDRDGDLDLVTIEEDDNAFFIAFGDGAGKFGTPVEYAIDVGGFDPIDLLVVDTKRNKFANRGMVDVVIADGNEDRVVIVEMALDGSGDPEVDSFDTIAPCGGTAPWTVDMVAMPQQDSYSPYMLAFACQNSEAVEIWDFTGAVWASLDTIDLSDEPTALATADFDYDGEADLAVGEDNGDVEVVRYTSSPDIPELLQDETNNALGAVTDIAIGDLDRDGQLDVVASDGTGARVFAAFGSLARDANNTPTRILGTSAMTSIATSQTPAAFELADLDRDGWLDLALAYPGQDSIGMRRSRTWRAGTGTEETVSTGATTDGPITVMVDDLNHDGWSDIALTRRVGNGNTRVGAVLTTARPDCDNTWSGAGTASTVAYPTQKTIAADIDGDGRTDMVHALGNGDNEGGVAIAYGRGNGRFNFDDDLVFTSNDSTSAIAVGDLDNDGDNDIAAIDGGEVLVYRQGGRFTWTAMTGLGSLPDGTGPIFVADVDNDRRNDLVYLQVEDNGDSFIHIWLQEANGSFSEGPNDGIDIGSDAVGLSLADINRDGTLDFAFMSNPGTPNFDALCTLSSTGPRAWSTTTGDTNCTRLREGSDDLLPSAMPGFVNVDADPALELVIEVVLEGSETNTIQIRRPSTPGLYSVVEDDGSNGTDPMGYQFCTNNRDPVFGAFGGESIGLDMAVRCSDLETVRVYERDADNYDNDEVVQTGQDVYFGTLAAGDYDGDHRTDIVYGTTVYPVHALEESGDLGSGVFAGAVGDFDGNGFMDVAGLAVDDINVARQRAAEPGVFFPETNADINTAPAFGPVAGDFDADGVLDVAYLYSSSASDQGIVIQTQQSLTSFSENALNVADGGDQVILTLPEVMDFDGTGFDDIALATSGANGRYIYFIRQWSPGNFDFDSSFTGMSSIVDIAAGRLLVPDDARGYVNAVAAAGTCGAASPRSCVVVVNVGDGCEGCESEELTPKSAEAITAIAVGDLNRDGLDDIAIVQDELDGGLRFPAIFLQTTSGSFVEVNFAANALPAFAQTVRGLEIADVDRDGWPDLVGLLAMSFANESFNAISIVPNAGTVPFGLSRVTRHEGLGYLASSWFVGDLWRTGRVGFGFVNSYTTDVFVKR